MQASEQNCSDMQTDKMRMMTTQCTFERMTIIFFGLGLPTILHRLGSSQGVNEDSLTHYWGSYERFCRVL